MWPGTISVLTPRGLERAEDEEGGVYVLPAALRPVIAGDLACDWRDGEPW